MYTEIDRKHFSHIWHAIFSKIYCLLSQTLFNIFLERIMCDDPLMS